MEDVQLIVVVLLSFFAALFIVCIVVTCVRHNRNTKRKSRNWEERYGSISQEQLENKRRVWAMFGLEYRGTVDDVRQSEEGGEGRRDPPTNRTTAPSPPPPYLPAEDIGAKDGLWGHRTPPPCSTRPNCVVDAADNVETNHIASPRPRRILNIREPELAAFGPLRRNETIRSVRRSSAPPAPEPTIQNTRAAMSDADPSTRRNFSEPGLEAPGLEPPLSPRRLDSISRRRAADGEGGSC